MQSRIELLIATLLAAAASLAAQSAPHPHGGGGISVVPAICPTGSNFAHNPDAGLTGCNVLITVSAGGSVSVTVRDPIGYVNDDILVGVWNLSGAPLNSLAITSPGAFGFDGSGICTYIFTGNSYCTLQQTLGVDPQDYQGPTSTFTVASTGNGTVNFNPPVAPNGATYFSLDMPASLGAFAVLANGVPPVAVPAISSWGLVALCALLMGAGAAIFSEEPRPAREWASPGASPAASIAGRSRSSRPRSSPSSGNPARSR